MQAIVIFGVRSPMIPDFEEACERLLSRQLEQVILT